MKAIGFIESFRFNIAKERISMDVEVPTDSGGSWVTTVSNIVPCTLQDAHDIVDMELLNRKIEIVKNNDKWLFSKLI